MNHRRCRPAHGPRLERPGCLAPLLAAVATVVVSVLSTIALMLCPYPALRVLPDAAHDASLNPTIVAAAPPQGAASGARVALVHRGWMR